MTPPSSMTNSKTLLFVSFGLLLSVIVVLIALGVARIETFNRQINALTEAQGRKIAAVSELFGANGRRADLIDKVFAVPRPKNSDGDPGDKQQAAE